MYLIERIEFGTVTGCWQYGSFEEAKRRWNGLYRSSDLYPLLTVDGGALYHRTGREAVFCRDRE